MNQAVSKDASQELIPSITLLDLIQAVNPKHALIICDMSGSVPCHNPIYDDQIQKLSFELQNSHLDIALYKESDWPLCATQIYFVGNDFSFSSPPDEMRPYGGTMFEKVLSNDLLEDYDLVIHLTDGFLYAAKELPLLYQKLCKKDVFLSHICTDDRGIKELKQFEIGPVFGTL